MKKYLFLVLMSLFLVSCSGNSPKSVATKFIESVNKGELEEAKKYCDGATADMLNVMSSLAGNKIKENAKGEEFKITKVEENGDKAKVYYTSGKDNKENSLDMKKIDGEWKVSIDKEQAKKEESTKDVTNGLDIDSTSVAE